MEGNFEFVTGQRIGSPVKVGVEYHVIHEQQEPEGLYYSLIEFHPDMGFAAVLFVDLPEQSADEMGEESRESIVNIETPVV